MSPTKIEWCSYTNEDGVFVQGYSCNFWWGCEKVSPACTHCYARCRHLSAWRNLRGKDKPRRFIKSAVNEALKLNAKAEKEGVRYKVFTNSMADFFEEDHGQPIVDHKGNQIFLVQPSDANNWSKWQVETETADYSTPAHLGSLRELAFETIDKTPHLDWLVLTKRPENIMEMWPKPMNNALSPNRTKRENVWLGTTVENQEFADQRIPDLLKCRDLSPVLFLSCEPLLGPVDLSHRDGGRLQQNWNYLTGSHISEMWDGGMGVVSRSPKSIDWVICGGESGHKARPMHPDWARSLRDQCVAAGVPYFFKQWGEKAAGRLLDGQEWNQIPEVQNA